MTTLVRSTNFINRNTLNQIECIYYKILAVDPVKGLHG